MTLNIIWLTADRFDLKPNQSPWLEMAKCFANNGHKVTILTSKSTRKKPQPLYDTNIAYVKAIDFPLLFRISVLFKMIFWLKKHATPTDIIILNPDAILIVPFLKRLGLNNIHLDIRTIPVDRYSFKDHLDEILYWYLPLKLFARKIGSYSFITERLREEVEREFKLNISNYVIWQSGVNSDMFYPLTNTQKTTIPKKFCLFYHGTISINRGIGLVIEALSLLEKSISIEFVIVGDGTGLNELKSLTNNLALNTKVVFKGLMPYKKMAEEISKADMCICPLTDRLEWNVSSPIKIFEYMACGKPMILTPISAHKDVVKQLPFVVWTKGFKPHDFQQAITESIENHEALVSAATTAAPQHVKTHFQWLNQAAKLETIIIKNFKSTRAIPHK